MKHLTFILILAACGPAAQPATSGQTTPSSSTSTATTATTTSSTSAVTSGVRRRSDEEMPRPDSPWAEMDHGARGAYMHETVTPYMRELFQEFDPERYADFGCADCHGQEMAARNFEMPSPDLMPLHASGTDEQRAMVQEHPQMVRFMFNHVVPGMRTMIEAEELNAETGEGFSCFTCHPAAE